MANRDDDYSDSRGGDDQSYDQSYDDNGTRDTRDNDDADRRYEDDPDGYNKGKSYNDDGEDAQLNGNEDPDRMNLTSSALRPFVIISSSYLLFTITDGAIRMIVLLHAYNKNFSAFEVAIMFSLYEVAGVVTNLLAGFMGANWGIKVTLISGLSLQLVAYGMLFGWQDDWDKNTAIIYVTIAQMFAGIAKDLTKLGGKTVTKLVTPEDQDSKLFKLVSLITGWKNSLKGVGYFLGSALLQISYFTALITMMVLVLLAMPWVILSLDRNLGMAKTKNASFMEIFTLNNKNLNWLSLARLFLFASRDFWFEVPLPFYLRSPDCLGLGSTFCNTDADCGRSAICGLDSGICENLNIGGGCGGLGMDRVYVGIFLGGYIILYGQIQSWSPQLVIGPLDQSPPNKLAAVFWNFINCLPTVIMAFVMHFAVAFINYKVPSMTIWLIAIIGVFAFIFAVNSAIHSYLVVKYAEADKIAVSVGFYYMSNALGRLFGTISSGILYTWAGENLGPEAGTNATAGLAACFLAGTFSSLLAAVVTLMIDDQEEGLKCGGCCFLIPAASGASQAYDDDKIDENDDEQYDDGFDDRDQYDKQY
eukprot:CAMPEP_0198283292 /NCGR_PEP_ID=MMETSP1449-20131203/2938_1 /TAXON_ID=420275 /ORGANISM="Attheya septentrionalis, Strain CCMP2084" /LENGTH=588 /DNA_ID=CAMNT_0043979873 /DNA_START=75 /DNA_END=1841 /DNA_ORIENTATION=+